MITGELLGKCPGGWLLPDGRWQEKQEGDKCWALPTSPTPWWQCSVLMLWDFCAAMQLRTKHSVVFIIHCICVLSIVQCTFVYGGPKMATFPAYCRASSLVKCERGESHCTEHCITLYHIVSLHSGLYHAETNILLNAGSWGSFWGRFMICALPRIHISLSGPKFYI